MRRLLAKCRFAESLATFEENKETVLLVTHEVSRTGAPILVLNLANSLKKKYNILLLALGSGSLAKEFSAASDLMIGPLSGEQLTPRFLELLFREVPARVALKYAVVSSMASGAVLSALWENDIPAVHLIHEFPACMRPRGQFRTSKFFSSEQIFSAEMVRMSALEETPEQTAKGGLVIPQGICVAPNSLTAEARAKDREQIRADLRPVGWPKDTVVVLGAGLVHLRKGVDLFIACAKRVAEMMPKRRFRFVWIGDGFNPEQDVRYSVYLEDQLKRSNLGETFAMLEAVSDIEGAYLDSNIFFLSSRLDPLPLVAMDALYHRRPVVCFESTTGIADYLSHDPLLSFGIAPYLDVEQAACRIFRLIEDNEFRLRIGEASRELAKSQFSMERYVEQVDAIALRCAAKKEQEKSDRAVISKSKLFDTSFFESPLSQENQHDPIKSYISAYSSGIRPRKALPGFHPGIYAEHHQLDRRDPLAHYLDNGRLPGPWTFDVIRPGQNVIAEKSLRVGLHLNLYYHEMADEILERLRRIRSGMDLLISVPDSVAAEAIRTSLSAYFQGDVDVRVFNKRGRDIGPFLTGFAETILNGYDVIGHMHTNKLVSSDISDVSTVQAWRRFLYANLLADKQVMADAVIHRFAKEGSIGLVFADDPHIIGWGDDYPFAFEVAQRLGIAHLLPKTTFNFPAGTMFWARTAALKPLLELSLSWEQYPEEPVSGDGNFFRAVEKVLPFVVEKAGFRSAVTHVPGVTW